MKIRKIFVLAGILILPSLAFSADNALEFRVKLDVRGDESIASRIESNLSDELQALGDVIQPRNDCRYEINVIGVKLRNTFGGEVGAVLSVNVLTRFSSQHFSYMFKEEFRKAGTAYMDDLYYYPKHWVKSGSIHDLSSMCRRIIADFDSQILQKQRDEFQGHLIDLENESLNR